MAPLRRSLLALALFALPAAAQNVKRVALGPGAKEFPEPFSEVSQLAELKDGRVIVVDANEKKLLLVDFAKGTATQISRTGAGPLEYQVPGVLHASTNDTVVYFDMMQRRLLLLNQQGTVIRTAAYGNPGDPGAMNMMIPTGLDASGRLWGQTTGFHMSGSGKNQEPTFADTVEIQWYDRRTAKATTLTKIVSATKQTQPKMQMSEGKFQMTLTAPDYRPNEVWAALPDGRVALFKDGVYRAHLLAAGKPEVLGPVIPATPVPVTAAEQKALMDSLRALLDKQIEQVQKMGGANAPKMSAKILPPAKWAAVKPAVSSVMASPDGRLWVMTAAPHTAKTSLFDVLDGRGALIGKVQIPAGESAIGLGRGTIYTMRKDDDDQQYVRRYVLPALP